MKPKLSIVIHAEEEFDWSKGFYRSNRQVQHGQALIDVMNDIIALGGKITLAMDHPFVTSVDGNKVINHVKGRALDNIEFATHLHPWVNPPFEDNEEQVSNYKSFACHLEPEKEFEKIKNLTEEIEKHTDLRPVTYLAGRYGIGENTHTVLKLLGYKVDLSISAYSNFTHVEGPNFIEYTNKVHEKNGLIYIPHTCSMVAISSLIENHINLNPARIGEMQENGNYALMAKIFRIKKYRLSPEGFSLKELQKITKNQMVIGQEDFVLSFHSPSVMLGGTPYVQSEKALQNFKTTLLEYIKWFSTLLNAEFFLPSAYKIKVSEQEEID